MTEKKANRLSIEKSPYLLQHAFNPVDWYPWCEEAFEKATAEDRPVFLSIGYSTCHWCHVMEKESFENLEIAGLMNGTFISIKVDREERPDLDNVYMAVCQLLTGKGGWPLTIIMTPDKRPFFAGTYIPGTGRYGQVGMRDLIPHINKIWTTRRDEIFLSAEKITEALQTTEKNATGKDLTVRVMEKAFDDLSGRFDRTYGGFGDAPKFPTPHNFLFLLRFWKRTGNQDALEMVEKTLKAMRLGGIYDQVGYGFHRYSTDSKWIVPHFEKMLYDQALLAMAYLETWQATGKDIYSETAREIFTYVLRDMTSPEGGFYSAEDADSEGAEGKFYVWQEREIRQILGHEEAERIVEVFDVREKGNFADEATGMETGANILHTETSFSSLNATTGQGPDDFGKDIKATLERLFEYRKKRVPPHKDDKVLTDWNGLMIAALAQGARILGEPAYASASVRAADFILNKLAGPKGRLYHRYRDGEAGITAHLDDYAFLVWGLIELYEATFEVRFLEKAIDFNDVMLERFKDPEGGGLFFTPYDGERLIIRKKEVYDGAIPSGNSIVLLNLLRLSSLTGRTDLAEKGWELVRAFSGQVAKFPSGYTQFLASLDFGLGPSYEVIIAGPDHSRDTMEMVRAVQTRFIPNCVLIFHPTDQEAPDIEKIAGFTRGCRTMEGRPAAYVCKANTCNAPVTQVDKLLELLK